MLFQLLGIDFGADGDKEGNFAPSFKALGLILDLSQLTSGRVAIAHTPERKGELDALLASFPKKNAMTPKEAESLLGRLHWYETYLFGRVANLAIHNIGRRVTMVGRGILNLEDPYSL